MNRFEEASVTYRRAIEITVNYLLNKGYSERAARDNAQAHVISLFNITNGGHLWSQTWPLRQSSRNKYVARENVAI